MNKTITINKPLVGNNMGIMAGIKTYSPAIIACVALFILGGILSPGFASGKNLASILSQSSLLVIIAIGQSIVFFAGNSGIDLSTGAFVSMGALIGAEFSAGRNEQLPLAILAIVVLGAVFGLCNGIGVQILRIPALAMTLAVSSIINGFTLAYTNGLPAALIPDMIGSVGKPLFMQVRPIMIIALIAIVFMEFIMRKTKFGRSIYLIGSNRSAAYLNGIKVNFTAIMAYVISGIVACFGGLLFIGYVGAGQILMGDDYTMMSIAAVVVGGASVAGGRGTFIGAALGSIVLVLLTSVLVSLGLSAGVRIFFQGVILAVILMITCRDAKLKQ